MSPYDNWYKSVKTVQETFKHKLLDFELNQTSTVFKIHLAEKHLATETWSGIEKD